MARIGVLGIGNVLMGDDALGPYVVQLLDSMYEVPADVELVDLGTPGADLPLYLDSLDAAVIYAWLRKMPLAKMGTLANAVGAAKVLKLGTGRNVPTRAEVRAILKRFGVAEAGILED